MNKIKTNNAITSLARPEVQTAFSIEYKPVISRRLSKQTQETLKQSTKENNFNAMKVVN